MRLRHFSLAAFALAALEGCGSDSSAPKIGPPSAIDLASSPSAKGAVTTSVGTFSVKVTDANARPVSGAVVNFTVSGGGGVVLAPSSVTTDASGIAATTVTLGTRTGAVILTATVSGLSKRIDALVTSTPGPLATINSNPDAIKLWEVGDTARITSVLLDEFRNSVTDFVPTFTPSDPTLVSVDGTGLVRALRKGGTTMVTVSASGRSDSVAIRVAAVGESPCTGAATATPLAVGDPTKATAAVICVTGAASAPAEYTVIAYNTSIDGSAGIYATVQANGVGTPPSSNRVPTASPLRASRAVAAGSAAPTAARPVLDESFHLRLLERARGMGARYRASRAAYDARLSRPRTSGGGLTPKMSLSRIPAGASIGDIISLNVSDESCDNAEMRGFRVTAVGTKSIVLADTLNPANGFSSPDYARFADRFDNLVYPLDVGNFGAPSDIDGNGKVAILFTKKVNELTPANSPYFVGGFFHPRDVFMKTGPATDITCATSNEGEMFYMLVPDPSGQVNGNTHTLGFVDTLTTSILAHEFQHLINATRRVYVNNTFVDFEESWLNEGLSHLAEELLYYQETGIQPRQNLNDNAIHSDPAKYQIWKADAGSNLSRFLSYVEDPGSASPLDSDDALATRGATWAFLRYAVDRLFASDASVWARFTNTESLGLTTLEEGLLTDPVPVLADFAVANYLDDLGISSDPRYTHKSWNFRDIYAKTFGSKQTGVFVPLGFYPILLTGVPDNVVTGATVRGSSASYFRLSVGAGKEALLTFNSGSGTPSPLLKFIVVRTQ
jgi:Bacterial Ig-like domain (group 1)